MSEKNMQLSLLLDFYGELLPTTQRDMMDLYYNEDLSLAEIAEQIGITRQGVRDSVRRAEDTLAMYEDKLGMAKRQKQFKALRSCAVRLQTLISAYDDAALQDAVQTLQTLLDTVD